MPPSHEEAKWEFCVDFIRGQCSSSQKCRSKYRVHPNREHCDALRKICLDGSLPNTRCIRRNCSLPHVAWATLGIPPPSQYAAAQRKSKFCRAYLQGHCALDGRCADVHPINIHVLVLRRLCLDYLEKRRCKAENCALEHISDAQLAARGLVAAKCYADTYPKRSWCIAQLSRACDCAVGVHLPEAFCARLRRTSWREFDRVVGECVGRANITPEQYQYTFPLLASGPNSVADSGCALTEDAAAATTAAESDTTSEDAANLEVATAAEHDDSSVHSDAPDTEDHSACSDAARDAEDHSAFSAAAHEEPTGRAQHMELMWRYSLPPLKV